MVYGFLTCRLESEAIGRFLYPMGTILGTEQGGDGDEITVIMNINRPGRRVPVFLQKNKSAESILFQTGPRHHPDLIRTPLRPSHLFDTYDKPFPPKTPGIFSSISQILLSDLQYFSPTKSILQDLSGIFFEL